jgi:glycerol kinase
MAEDMGGAIKAFKVDGGACANNFLLEFQADIMNMPLYRPECIETTSLGAAYLAGLATGYWENIEDVISNWQIDKKFEPAMEEVKRAELLDGWHKAVKCTFGWAK